MRPGGSHATVDHCHDSTAVRGILCVDGSDGPGKFEDDVDVTERRLFSSLRG